MGADQSIRYSVEVPNQLQKEGETKVRRHPDYVGGLLDSPEPSLNTMKDIILHSFKTYPNLNMLGRIITEKVEPKQKDKQSQPVSQTGKESSGLKEPTEKKVQEPKKEGKKESHPKKDDYIPKSIEYLTYKQVQQKVDALGTSLVSLDLVPINDDVPDMKMRFIAIFSKNRVQWTMVDLACALFGFTLVPIYDTLGPENIPYVLEHTRVQTCFCTKQSVEVLLKTQQHGNLKNLVCFDRLPEETETAIKKAGLVLHRFEDLISNSKSNPKHVIVKPNDCLTFCYTSGTTGPPKGAMLSHKNVASFCAVLKTNRDIDIKPGQSYLSYLPLAHVLERLAVYAMIYSGGTVTSYSGDVQKINLDLDLVKPHLFISVPRLLNRFYDIVNSKFKKTEGIQKILLDRALSTKLQNLQQTGSVTHMVYDRLIFNKTKAIFGGQMTVMLSGSAPLLPHVENFLKVISCTPIIEGYGQTESTGASFVTSAHDPQCAHVGGPTANIEYKLVDVTELNYSSKDINEDGQRQPRGEICVKGPGVFLGYYKDVAKTKEAIDEDGWLHTGDIGTILPETGALKIIDRKKNIFKLQQGEYVAAEKVEAVYMKDHRIEQVFLHGESTQSFAVAVVVPSQAYIKELVGSTENASEKINERSIREQILANINNLAKQAGLMSFEQAKNIYVEVKPFAQQGIVSTTMKLQRHEGKKFYKKQIDAMYEQGPLGGKRQ